MRRETQNVLSSQDEERIESCRSGDRSRREDSWTANSQMTLSDGKIDGPEYKGRRVVSTTLGRGPVSEGASPTARSSSPLG